MAVVSLKAQLGATPDQTRAELERLGKKYPDAAEPGVAITRLLLDKQDFKGAQQAARETLAAFPENPLALDIAGQAELAAGDLNQALQTFGKLASLAPRAAAPLQRQAQVYLARQDGPAAIVQLRKAVALEPTNRDVQLQLVTVLARTGKADEALQQAQAVQKLMPNEPLGWVMEGDLRVGRANYNGAVAAYQTALGKARVGATAVKLHRAMEDAGKLKEAQAFEQEWRRENPDDPLFNYYLADRYLVLNKPDIAEGLYRNVLKSVPNDGSSLNNLAWILGRKGDPEAIKFGERALAAAPNSPDFMDTVAELHANAGRTAQALTLQRRAVELAPNQPMLRLHLAQYLIKDNQRAAARKELEALAALGGKFSKQDEVKRLMDAP
jgi:putative PEP-CTERM system TPR-repeat lipoprotein